MGSVSPCIIGVGDDVVYALVNAVTFGQYVAPYVISLFLY